MHIIFRMVWSKGILYRLDIWDTPSLLSNGYGGNGAVVCSWPLTSI